MERIDPPAAGRFVYAAGMGAAHLQRFDPARLPELMRWFPDADAYRVWGGPSFRFPFTLESFRLDTRMDSLSTWGLMHGETLPGGGPGIRRLHLHGGRVAQNLSSNPPCTSRGMPGIRPRLMSAM
jgi:hypothetical protein